jgi:hypothetical protein
LESFRVCEGKARALLARLELLSQMGDPGQLSEENLENLTAVGVHVPEREAQEMTEKERYLHLLRTLLLSLDMTIRDLLTENAYVSADSILARNALLLELNDEKHA